MIQLLIRVSSFAIHCVVSSALAEPGDATGLIISGYPEEERMTPDLACPEKPVCDGEFDAQPFAEDFNLDQKERVTTGSAETKPSPRRDSGAQLRCSYLAEWPLVARRRQERFKPEYPMSRCAVS
jgi:hypothetical protein